MLRPIVLPTSGHHSLAHPRAAGGQALSPFDVAAPNSASTGSPRLLGGSGWARRHGSCGAGSRIDAGRSVTVSSRPSGLGTATRPAPYAPYSLVIERRGSHVTTDSDVSLDQTGRGVATSPSRSSVGIVSFPSVPGEAFVLLTGDRPCQVLRGVMFAI